VRHAVHTLKIVGIEPAEQACSVPAGALAPAARSDIPAALGSECRPEPGRSASLVKVLKELSHGLFRKNCKDALPLSS
jgi:hypothetical protein